MTQSQASSPSPQISAQPNVEKATSAVAMVLAAKTPTRNAEIIGAALVVRENGMLLTAYHVVRNASVLQVRFKSGEVFDQVQLLGVDPRRDVAAIRITASGLPVLPIAGAANANPGDAVTTISHPQALPWSVSTGVVAAYRLADEVPGAGSGYKVIQFTAAASPGSSGGVLIDREGRALGLIVGSLSAGQNLNFAVPIENVLGLADAAVSKLFSEGSMLELPRTVAKPIAAPPATPAKPETAAGAVSPDLSEQVSSSMDKDFILRNFKTMFVDASNASFFGNEQMKAALARNAEFAALNIRIVDEAELADTVLSVGYTFAWDYPFVLKHRNSSTMLLAGKGYGPFSGPAGAASVASNFVKAAKPWRSPPTQK